MSYLTNHDSMESIWKKLNGSDIKLLSFALNQRDMVITTEDNVLAIGHKWQWAKKSRKYNNEFLKR